MDIITSSSGATDDHTQPEVTREGTARLGVLQSRLPVRVVGRDALISEVSPPLFITILQVCKHRCSTVCVQDDDISVNRLHADYR